MEIARKEKKLERKRRLQGDSFEETEDLLQTFALDTEPTHAESLEQEEYEKEHVDGSSEEFYRLMQRLPEILVEESLESYPDTELQTFAVALESGDSEFIPVPVGAASS